MNGRPAGFSDSCDSSDEEGFTFSGAGAGRRAGQAVDVRTAWAPCEAQRAREELVQAIQAGDMQAVQVVSFHFLF